MSPPDPPGFTDELDQFARDSGFSGVVRVDREGAPTFSRAYGLANRALGIDNTIDTRFAIASGQKSLTALTIVSVIESGALAPETTARSVLDRDLPLIDDSVTIEQLLSHRSGIGDYLDENEEHDTDDYVMTVPVHELATTEQYLAVLSGHPMKTAPGTTFAYCNGGFVVLALIAERVSGTPFHDLVRARVCSPAGMSDTQFLRSDELPRGVALGYLAGGGVRTNVFHLPVLGSGDGGIYTTVDDIHRLWTALYGGEIVSSGWVDRMTSPISDVSTSLAYGLGFWVHHDGRVQMEGSDAGVSFRSICDPQRGSRHTVIANESDGAWALSRWIVDRLRG